jgi:hypothetical protein
MILQPESKQHLLISISTAHEAYSLCREPSLKGNTLEK